MRKRNLINDNEQEKITDLEEMLITHMSTKLKIITFHVNDIDSIR